MNLHESFVIQVNREWQEIKQEELGGAQGGNNKIQWIHKFYDNDDYILCFITQIYSMYTNCMYKTLKIILSGQGPERKHWHVKLPSGGKMPKFV